LPYAMAALVHECLRLDEQYLLLVFDPFRDLGLKPRLKATTSRALSQQVDDAKTDVVARPVIAFARIAEADNDLHKSVPLAHRGYRKHHFSSGASSSAFTRPITSGSAASVAAAGAAASASNCFCVTCTTTTSASVMALTPSGRTRSCTLS